MVQLYLPDLWCKIYKLFSRFFFGMKDRSGAQDKQAKSLALMQQRLSAKEFANSILAEGTGNKLAVIGFAHNKDNGGVDKEALTVSQDLTDNKSLIDTKINQMKADGGTNYTAALDEAQEYLNGRSESDKANRPGYVIFISDGAPGRTGESF